MFSNYRQKVFIRAGLAVVYTCDNLVKNKAIYNALNYQCYFEVQKAKRLIYVITAGMSFT